MKYTLAFLCLSFALLSFCDASMFMGIGDFDTEGKGA